MFSEEISDSCVEDAKENYSDSSGSPTDQAAQLVPSYPSPPLSWSISEHPSHCTYHLPERHGKEAEGHLSSARRDRMERQMGPPKPCVTTSL